ncbi:MAG: Glycosyltransferase, AglL family [Candidatus Methanohalarchaeum thermophilum]|uniref:Glycosyltransferase, AglL family n=1 Tax=Methanohalarchaeum thermophilum TaxID=1903181 RepID=A0A1Q6DU66_METT1|nr:MAG: Glycosyltransferase, AglL family [Candidatus Methanohalarchaeum thermophilum]
MRIAYVSDVMYPWVKGGAEKRIWEIAKRIANNHDVHVFTMKWWEKDSDILNKENITIHGISPKKRLYSEDRRSIKEAIYFTTHLLKLEKGFDIYDFNQFPYIPAFLGKLKTLNSETKLVITWHEFWGDYWYDYLGRLGFFGKNIEKMVSHLPDEIISVSELTKRKLENIGQDSVVIPNGIDLKEIKETKRSDKEYDIIYIGRLIKEKNVDILLKALKSTDYSLCIVGKGPMERKLKEISNDLQIDVDYYKDIPYSELIGYLKSSKVSVQPSSREGFGITVLESMAAKTPVITVNEPDNAAKNLINGKNGKVTQLNENKIRRKLTELLENKDKLDEMGSYGREFAQKFSWDSIAERTSSFYESMLS